MALDQGILKCISTDTVRAVMRSFVSREISPALHRSSYSGDGDPVLNWRETTVALEASVEALVVDAINRGVSLVVEGVRSGLVRVRLRVGLFDTKQTHSFQCTHHLHEGVHVVPSSKLIRMWEDSGGVAMGCILTISEADDHRDLIYKRGEITKKGEAKKVT